MARWARDGPVGGALGGGDGDGEVVPDLASEAHTLPCIGRFCGRSGLWGGF